MFALLTNERTASSTANDEPASKTRSQASSAASQTGAEVIPLAAAIFEMSCGSSKAP
jgi:hypothetical protein